jgi:hypothetical protein
MYPLAAASKRSCVPRGAILAVDQARFSCLLHRCGRRGVGGGGGGSLGWLAGLRRGMHGCVLVCVWRLVRECRAFAGLAVR